MDGRVRRLRGYRADVAFDGDRQLSGGALVLVEGEVIVGVEPGAASVPADCEVTYIEGSSLLPGLIDTHVHLCGDDSTRALEQLPELSSDDLDRIIGAALRAQVRAGVTAVRDLGDIDWAVVDRRATSPGEPYVMASGPPITSVRGHCWNMGGEVSGADEIRAAVRERADRGVDVVKVMASGGGMTITTDVLACQFTLEELRLLVDEAHRVGLPVTAHAHAVAAVEQAVEAGVDSIEHGTCLSLDGIRTPPGLGERIAAAGIPVCPTLGLLPGASPPPQILAMLERIGASLRQRREQVGEFYRAGVRLISGGDSGISPAKPHGVLTEAVIELSAAGPSAAEALASVTGDAADACGLGSRTGRFRSGLAADLVFVHGDVFADITALRSVAHVVARGRDVDLAGV